MPTPISDPSWQQIAAAQTVNQTSYATLGTTTAVLSPLGFSSSQFLVSITDAGAATTLFFKLLGSMDGSTFEDVLAAFADSSNLETDVAAYELDASDLVATNARFRLRLDEPWAYLRLQAYSDAADLDIGPLLFRRVA